MSMKLKQIHIEGMHKELSKTYRFDGSTYLFGPNGAGKSTVLQAIQLAILGYIPDTGKTNASIYQHASQHSLCVEATLQNDHGETIEVKRAFTPSSKTSITSSLTVEPEGYDIESIIADLELPIFNFQDFINMSPNALKDWFIKFLPDSNVDVDWENELKGALGDMNHFDQKYFDDILAYIQELKKSETSDGGNLAICLSLNSKFKSDLSFMKSQKDSIESTIRSLVYYDDAEDVTSVEEIRSEINSMNDLLNRLRMYNNIEKSNEKIRTTLETVHTDADSIENDETYRSLLEQISELNEKKQKLGEDLRDKQFEVSEIISSIKSKAAIIKGEGICPYVRKECQEIKDLIQKLEKEIHENQLKEEAINQERGVLSQQLSEVEDTLLDLRKKSASIAGNYQTKANLISCIVPNIEKPTDRSEQEILDVIKSLNDTMEKAIANQKYNELAETMKKSKFTKELDILMLKAWITFTDANHLQAKLMDKPFLDLESDLDGFLQKFFREDGSDMHAKFKLESKANSFSFGLSRDGKYIPFKLLSSGEKCLYTIALMMCLTSRSKSPLKLVLIDDLLDHLDSKNINQLFETISNVEDIQFIFAGVQMCDSGIPVKNI